MLEQVQKCPILPWKGENGIELHLGSGELNHCAAQLPPPQSSFRARLGRDEVCELSCMSPTLGSSSVQWTCFKTVCGLLLPLGLPQSLSSEFCLEHSNANVLGTSSLGNLGFS